MSEQPSTSRLPVALAAFFLVAAIGAFGVVFYLYDGVGAVAGFVDTFLPTSEAPASTQATTTVDANKLMLPAGMPEGFALRLWQEQLDSQEMITRLVTGEVTSLRVDRVVQKGDTATLYVTVRFETSPQTSGAIGLRRFGTDWYIAGVGALREGEVVTPSAPVPTVDEVDVTLLNTMIAENRKSQKVIGEYLDGNVRQVIIDKITAGPKTATMSIEMEEGHGEGYANLVAIQEEVDGNRSWFLARFTKTGHDPADL